MNHLVNCAIIVLVWFALVAFASIAIHSPDGCTSEGYAEGCVPASLR